MALATCPPSLLALINGDNAATAAQPAHVHKPNYRNVIGQLFPRPAGAGTPETHAPSIANAKGASVVNDSLHSCTCTVDSLISSGHLPEMGKRGRTGMGLGWRLLSRRERGKSPHHRRRRRLVPFTKEMDLSRRCIVVCSRTLFFNLMAALAAMGLGINANPPI